MAKYIVQTSDIGKGSYTALKSKCDCCGTIKTTFPFEPLGRVQAIDVGRKLVLQNGIWYAESMEQFKNRVRTTLFGTDEDSN